jgi:hypothetical protein
MLTEMCASSFQLVWMGSENTGLFLLFDFCNLNSFKDKKTLVFCCQQEMRFVEKNGLKLFMKCAALHLADHAHLIMLGSFNSLSIGEKKMF